MSVFCLYLPWPIERQQARSFSITALLNRDVLKTNQYTWWGNFFRLFSLPRCNKAQIDFVGIHPEKLTLFNVKFGSRT